MIATPAAEQPVAAMPVTPPPLPSTSAASAVARRLRVIHQTNYSYDRPISRSVQRLLLKPIDDRLQSVVEHKLTIETEAGPLPVDDCYEYDDPFGNATTRLEITQPFQKLSIRAESVVDLTDIDPFKFPELRARPKFPVSWMPSERMMLAPYLTPIELPETQLEEIYAYARTFVDKNHGDLFETLFDVNLTLFRDYAYVPLSTNLETTPFDVLTSKQGVCQDYANLMICMMRMLDIPARYVCGYVYTGNTGAVRSAPDATHAWVQLYLPSVGWKSFDPTNGVLPATQHVRSAVGRHYRETAPISGTLYSPAVESMAVDVEVSILDPATPAEVAAPVADG